MKTIPIKVKRREGNDFYCITIGGQEIKFRTQGERDPKFHILGGLYIDDIPFNLTVPDGMDLK